MEISNSMGMSLPPIEMLKPLLLLGSELAGDLPTTELRSFNFFSYYQS